MNEVLKCKDLCQSVKLKAIERYTDIDHIANTNEPSNIFVYNVHYIVVQTWLDLY